MKKSQLQVVVYREGEHFVAQCLDVDVSSFGNTEDQALKAIREALELYFENHNNDDVHEVENPKVKTVKLQHA